jgi:hypothetical protein
MLTGKEASIARSVGASSFGCALTEIKSRRSGTNQIKWMRAIFTRIAHSNLLVKAIALGHPAEGYFLITPPSSTVFDPAAGHSTVPRTSKTFLVDLFQM